MAMRPDRIALDLVDQNGAAFSRAQLMGRFSLVYFGFLHCRVVCPRSLDKISKILRLLGPLSAKLRALYISVDPERDAPEAMRRYLSGRYPMILGLTGEADAVEAAKRSMRVFSRRKADPEDPDGYAVPHSAILYLLDEEGRYLTHFADHLDAETVAARLKEALADP